LLFSLLSILKLKKIKIIEYSGYRAFEKPRAFVFEGKRYNLKKIISNKREYFSDNGKYYETFKVETEEGKVFVLIMDCDKNEWFLKK